MRFARVLVLAGCCQLFGFYAAHAETLQTRFGTLSTAPDSTLLFNGRPIRPTIQGNNSLTFVKGIRLGDADVVVVQDNGGTACPAQYYAVTVSRQGVSSTKAFGTCSDLVQVAQQGSAVILTMPEFARSSSNRKHVFRVEGDAVTDNGRPVR